jgi:hypothetical protein
VNPISCLKTTVPNPDSRSLAKVQFLHECSVPMFSYLNRSDARFFRARVETDVEERWCIYEIWLRGVLRL